MYMGAKMGRISGIEGEVIYLFIFSRDHTSEI
jgi:hypothetical protein